jgi:hypothetical protein
MFGHSNKQPTPTQPTQPTPTQPTQPTPTQPLYPPPSINHSMIRMGGSDTSMIYYKRKGVDQKIVVIKEYFDKTPELIPITSNLHLPKSVLDFITLLKPNAKGLFDKNGTISVEMNITVLQSAETFEVFLGFFHAILAKFPTLEPYTSLYEKTIQVPRTLPVPKDWPTTQAVTSNIYIQIRVLDMLIEKLIYHFRPEDDFPVSDALTFCLEHGISDNELIETFNVPKSSYYRLKTPIPKMGKSEQEPRPSERTDLALTQNKN